MTAVLAVGAIAVFGAVVARLTWRRPTDERHSVREHQQTLETLRTMAARRSARPRLDEQTGAVPAPSRGGPSGRRPRPATRALPSMETSARAPSGAHARSEPAAASTPGALGTTAGRERPPSRGRPTSVRVPAPAKSASNGHRELVFGDDTTVPAAPGDGGHERTPTPGGARPLHRPHRPLRLGPAPSRRTRVAVAVLVAAAVLGTVVGLTIAGHRTHTGGRPAASPPKHSRAKAQHSPPVTTVAVAQPTTSTLRTAAYVAPSPTYTVELRATGLCWIEATETATGEVLSTGTLQPGQTRTLPATGTLEIVLGAPDDIVLTLNGETVQLPPGFLSPFDVSFAPA